MQRCGGVVNEALVFCTDWVACLIKNHDPLSDGFVPGLFSACSEHPQPRVVRISLDFSNTSLANN